MGRQDALMGEGYFIERDAFLIKRIPEMEQKLAQSNAPAPKKMAYQYSLFREMHQHLLVRYTLGADVQELHDHCERTIDAFEKYKSFANICAKSGQYIFPEFSELEDYVVSLWLISFALIFEVDAALFDRLLKCIGNEGRDKLFERLVATRVSGRTVATDLMFPKVYEPLYNAIDVAEPERSKLIGQFLKDWYKNMKPTYWYDCHKGPEGGGFFGYWAIEAAGVVKAFEIDDSAFRDLPYYPKDLLM